MQTQPILIVDDEPDMRVALSHALSRSGYSVDCASSGFEALEKFRKDDYSMVITDMKMPEMTGIELLGRVKGISPQVPVIMITAYGTINNAVEAMQEGASDYILKPFSAETLEATVKKAGMRPYDQSKVKINEVYEERSPELKRIITQDTEVINVLNLAEDVATSNATVLILGESGTGKELLACYIHYHSGRKDRPYIAVNCAALPENLAESELFGHERGSFTGAVGRKMGKFELANNGTILLDEITEMPLHLQAKLLRVLQEREIDRVGGGKPIPIDIRVIAVSNIDLKKAVEEGRFREDLYYRINVIPLYIPPLRERKKDIPLLVDYFLDKYSAPTGRKMTRIADETISLLMKYDWKGNVRELENTIERAVLLGKGDVLLPKHLFLEEKQNFQKKPVSFKVGTSVREMEKELIFQTLREVDNNRTYAAELLGISIRTLRNKLKEYNAES